MKSRDLVVVAIRHDHGLGRVGIAHFADEFGADAQRVHARHIIGPIAADGCHRQWRAAQLPQAIGDIAGAAAKFPAQGRHQKGHIEDVKLIRQDLLGKAALKGHDGVKGQGTTNYSRHGCLDSIKGKKQEPGSRQCARGRKAAAQTPQQRWRRDPGLKSRWQPRKSPTKSGVFSWRAQWDSNPRHVA